ncbi:MAG TPA: hypothetical protein VI861_04025, partial [Rickettsiales bacterium]|nr:hypothetical protein [Rickettsiales bacterium]
MPNHTPLSSSDQQQYYVIEKDLSKLIKQSENKLNYVKFNQAGLQKLLEYYNKAKKYNLNIAIKEFTYPYEISNPTQISSKIQNSEEVFQAGMKEIEEIHKSLANNQLAGLIFLLKDKKGNMNHAIPYLIAKGANGEKTLILFEDIKGETEDIFRQRMKHIFDEAGYHIKKVPNYSDFVKDTEISLKMQSDYHSCPTFSLDILKNCLRDEKFKKSCFDETYTTKELKGTMGQSPLFEGAFKSAYRANIVDNRFQLDDEGKYNLKAWYKSHDYARKINSNHLALLPQQDRDLILAIDVKRGKMAAPSIIPTSATKLDEIAELESIQKIIADCEENLQEIAKKINEKLATKNGDDFYKPPIYSGIGAIVRIETVSNKSIFTIEKIHRESLAEQINLAEGDVLQFTKNDGSSISEDEVKFITTNIRNLNFIALTNFNFLILDKD